MDTKALKDKILQLAIQGKLVEQDVNDESASVLLEKIKKEKEKLIREKKIKRENPLPEIKEDEKPFELPDEWEWVRLGQIISFQNGYAFKSNEFTSNGTGIVRIGDIVNCEIVEDKMVYISENENMYQNYKVSPGDLVIAMSGATTGKLGFNKANKTFYLNQRVGKIETINCDKKYIFCLLSTKVEENLNKSTGSAIPNLSTQQINNIVVSLPPLSEQNRIVAKVDELFAIIDELDNNKQDLLQNIADSRNKILQLAIQGKLVEQNEEDEPVSILLERITEEKERLIRDKKIKKETPPPEIREEEKSFDLPKGWEWIRLSSLVDYRGITYGVVVPGKDEPIDGIYMLRCSDVRYRYIDNSNIRKIDKNISQKYSRTILKGGELLVNVRGTLGGCAIVPEFMKDFNIAREVAMIPLINSINKKFILNVISSPFFQNNINNGLRGVAYKGLNINILQNFTIPLPPLEEQNRIVEKVDMSMGHLDSIQNEMELS